MSGLSALAARIALLAVWITTPLIERTFHTNWFLPLLGILILPLTTLAYVLVFAQVGSVTGWNWLWVVLGFLLDLSIHSVPARQSMRARRGKAVQPQEVIN